MSLDTTRHRRLTLLGALSGFFLLIWIRDPMEKGNYPPCPTFFLTGFHCAGCGSLRCTNALIHGDIPQAFAYNPLALLVLPFLLLVLIIGSVRELLRRPEPERRRSPWLFYLVFAVLVTYSIVRNIPSPPFTYLAPHELKAVEQETP